MGPLCQLVQSLPALNQLTNMTVGQYIQIVNAQIGVLGQRFGATGPVQTSGPYSVSGVDVLEAVQLNSICPISRSRGGYQTSIGLQRVSWATIWC